MFADLIQVGVVAVQIVAAGVAVLEACTVGAVLCFMIWSCGSRNRGDVVVVRQTQQEVQQLEEEYEQFVVVVSCAVAVAVVYV